MARKVVITIFFPAILFFLEMAGLESKPVADSDHMVAHYEPGRHTALTPDRIHESDAVRVNALNSRVRRMSGKSLKTKKPKTKKPKTKKPDIKTKNLKTKEPNTKQPKTNKSWTKISRKASTVAFGRTPKPTVRIGKTPTQSKSTNIPKTKIPKEPFESSRDPSSLLQPDRPDSFENDKNRVPLSTDNGSAPPSLQLIPKTEKTIKPKILKPEPEIDDLPTPPSRLTTRIQRVTRTQNTTTTVETTLEMDKENQTVNSPESEQSSSKDEDESSQQKERRKRRTIAKTDTNRLYSDSLKESDESNPFSKEISSLNRVRRMTKNHPEKGLIENYNIYKTRKPSKKRNWRRRSGREATLARKIKIS